MLPKLSLTLAPHQAAGVPGSKAGKVRGGSGGADMAFLAPVSRAVSSRLSCRRGDLAAACQGDWIQSEEPPLLSTTASSSSLGSRGWQIAAGMSGLALTARSMRRRGRHLKLSETIARQVSVVAEAGATGTPPPPRGAPLKVAIAGGGVGGLTTALCMLKQGWDVTVYEKTGKFARFGGPIQLASNATSTLKAIDERLFERVMEKFTFTATRRCGIKDGLRSDGSFRMTDVLNPSYFMDANAPADWFVSFPLKECADFFKLPYTGVINRPDLQDILLDECRRLKPDFIENGNPVVGYENYDKGVTVKLSNGETKDYDVLVGADGIWSAVRAQMYKEGKVKELSQDGLSQQGCNYSGYTVFAGETVLKLGDYYECGYKVYIGPKRYFVTSDVGDGRIQWYAFLALPPGTKKAGDSWSGSSSSASEGRNVINYLKSLHEGWSSEIFHVLDNTPVESVEQRDLYDRWPEFFRSWSDGHVVLVGDAVHPMMPNLGQGGCQAIEDAYELTRSLASVQLYSQRDVRPKSNQKALHDFYLRRMPRVSIISLMSRVASDLIINLFDTPWSPHDSKGTDWKSYLTLFWKPLLQFLVFPAQFLYLYSYNPTGSMGDLPQFLEAEWRKRHKESSEKAFAHAGELNQRASSPSFFAKFEEVAA